MVKWRKMSSERVCITNERHQKCIQNCYPKTLMEQMLHRRMSHTFCGQYSSLSGSLAALQITAESRANAMCKISNFLHYLMTLFHPYTLYHHHHLQNKPFFSHRLPQKMLSVFTSFDFTTYLFLQRKSSALSPHSAQHIWKIITNRPYLRCTHKCPCKS